MKKYLLSEEGNFYKTALHCHSTISDGKFTPAELKKEYMERGFSAVAFTDHEIMLPHPELMDENFLPITGIEIAIDKKVNWGKFQNTYHMNVYSPEINRSVTRTFCESYVKKEHTQALVTDEMRENGTSEREYSRDFAQRMIDVATEEGCLITLNHPVWSLQTKEDYSGLKGLFGIEWMNTGADLSGYVDSMQPLVDLWLEGEKMCYPLATDDTHSIRQLGKSWIQVKAESLDYDTFFAALKRGDFYSSTGPEIQELYVKEGIVYIKVANAEKITLVCDHRYVVNVSNKEHEDVFEAQIPLADYREHLEHLPEGHHPWIRFDVVDANGKYARTRAYFPEELFD